MLFPGRVPYTKNQFQFFRPTTRLSPLVDKQDAYYSSPELNFSPHHLLYSQIKAPDDSNINSWRIVGLSTVLSLTCLLIVFYVLKMIWTRFRTPNHELDNLIESPTEWSNVEETDLASYGTIVP
ncbi:hypothetical protein M3Y97_00046100 [Aphelenchoides bicaudatus]|nr:hypothetical protein M3Y97_01160100 [Aphelenchoides bicaudatus]KAI6189784.1 hypothetical protein M3Y97_00046100 [Aphelenchoides bicaudatus]